LAGFIFIPQKENDVNFFRYQLSAADVNSHSKAGDRMSITFNVSEFTFSELTAELDNVKIPVNTEKVLYVPTFTGNVYFESADLLITILSGLCFNVFLDLDVIGFNDNTMIDTINVTDFIEPALNDDEQSENLILLQDDPSVLKLVNHLPNNLEARGNLTLTTNRKVVKIYDSDRVEGTVSIKAPLSFKVNMVRKQSKPESVEVHKDIRSKINEHLNSCQVEFEIENHLPFQTTIGVFFAKNEADVFTHSDLSFENLQIAPAITKIVNNELVVEESSTNKIIKTLSKSNLQLFTSPQLYHAVDLIVRGDQGANVTLHPDDYVHVTVKGCLNVTVKQ
jgi:hypothetical protein